MVPLSNIIRRVTTTFSERMHFCDTCVCLEDKPMLHASEQQAYSLDQQLEMIDWISHECHMLTKCSVHVSLFMHAKFMVHPSRVMLIHACKVYGTCVLSPRPLNN